MEFSKLNLNLLRALNALLKTKHVTYAGKMIGLSQSAMSISLKQLRNIYNDEILVRGIGHSMQLTSLGKSLVGPVDEAMRLIDDIFQGEKPFIPEKDSRTFHICMTDLPSYILLPTLIKRLQEEAPHIKIIIHHPQYFKTLDIFEPGDIDLLVGLFEGVPENLKTQNLFSDEGVIALRKDHPAIKNGKLEMEDFLNYPLIQFVNPGTAYLNFMDKNLARTGYDERVAIKVPHALTPLLAVMNTDYMTLTIKGVAKSLSQYMDITMVKPPFKVGPYLCHQYWHQKDNNDPAHKWLRQLVKEIADTVV